VADNNQEVIKLLNQDLYGEHDAILYYLTHAWTVAQQYGHQILEIANDEMRHFKWLGHTIAQLGGTPNLAVPDVIPMTDLASAMQKDVDAEIHAIDQYQAHVELIPLDPVKALLNRIVVDERDHLRQFRELLEKSHGEPTHSDPFNPETNQIAQKLQQSIHLEYQQMMAYLLKSFMQDHQRQIGMDMEERAIDEMQHMGWIGKRMGLMGATPKFDEVGASPITQGEADEAHLYHDMRIWALDAMPSLVPTIDRIMAQEAYHANS
jgi:bacterioferritin